jgi:hypothetical protein
VSEWVSEGIGVQAALEFQYYLLNAKGGSEARFFPWIYICPPAAEELRRDMKIQPVCVTSWQSFDRQKENEREKETTPSIS